MPENDLALLINAAQAAGDVARQFTGPTAKAWDKDDGAGPVTEADLAVNTLLHDKLQAARPDYGWLSEETEDTDDRLSCDTVFVVDPIDGTRSFIEGSNTWAHSLAIAHKGEVIAGVVYLPMRDKLYAAAKGQGATLNGSVFKVSARSELVGANVLSAKPGFAAQHWRSDVPDMIRHFRPSLAYRLGLVAEGRFDAMFTMRAAWEWDIAAGELLVREAGGVSSDLTGRALRFNNADPRLNGVITANAELHKNILSELAPVAPM